MSAGVGHSAALRASGSVYTWGLNNRGQLGRLAAIGSSSATAARVPDLPKAKAIATGDAHTLALTLDGDLYTWGANDTGQLGDTTTTDRNRPTAITTGDDHVAIAAGHGASYAITTSGTVTAWGKNTHGQLCATPTTAPRTSPQTISGLSDITAIAASATYTLFLRNNGTVSFCGQNNAAPTTLPITAITQIAAGNNHTLALRQDGTVLSWGANANGELGNGTTTANYTPTTVPGLTDVTSIATGSRTSYATHADGTIKAWGASNYGQTGTGNTNQLTPTTITGLALRVPSRTITYTYDAAGLLQERHTTHTDHDKTWDPTSPIPLLLDDGNRSIIYGPDNQPIAQIERDNTVAYYHQDQIGSTRQLTDHTGNVLTTLTYDTHGRILNQAGTTTPSLDYAQAPTDPDTHLHYLRARWHDPTTGQFVTRDPLETISGDPYLYAAGDPLNNTDPTGLLPGLQEISDGIAGFGDTVTGGLTKKIRGAIGSDGVNYCSLAYAGGKATGAAFPVGGAVAGLARAARSPAVRARLADETGSFAPFARRGDTLPKLDRTGKVHGELPPGVPGAWTRSDLEEFASDLRSSIRMRHNEQVRLGEDGPHRARIDAERQLLRQIEKRLSGS